MTKLMKRYEAETGKQPNCGMTPTVHFVVWLAKQLTWRPISEKPKKAGVYFVEARPYAGCDSTTITTAYFDGESFLWHAVVRWLPIPPALEGEVK